MKNIYLQIRYNLPLHFILILLNWMPENRISLKVRGMCAKPFIKNCGKNLHLGGNLTLLNPYNLTIGNNVYIAKNTWINAMGFVEIEDEVVISPNVVISSLQHVFKDKSVRFGGSIAKKVVIGYGSWIAANSTIKCGVIVGKGNVLASNSSLIKSTPDFMLSGGVPAKIIQEVTDGEAEFFSRKEQVK